MTSPRRWLIKSEPTEYSIDDLARDKRDWWTGVRNYQARNFMRDEMAPGDEAFFYHSSCAAPGVVGIVKVAERARPIRLSSIRKANISILAPPRTPRAGFAFGSNSRAKSARRRLPGCANVRRCPRC